jgi:hypothetical protein
MWHRRWREMFAVELHAATGCWTHLGFDWHVFSYGYHSHVARDDAWAAFRRVEVGGAFVVLSACDHDFFGFACSGKPPDHWSSRVDVLFAAHSMSWTMAFTHEADCGPYFATA